MGRNLREKGRKVELESRNLSLSTHPLCASPCVTILQFSLCRPAFSATPWLQWEMLANPAGPFSPSVHQRLIIIPVSESLISGKGYLVPTLLHLLLRGLDPFGQ